MDFSKVNKWTIGGKEVKVLTINGQKYWEKKAPQPQITPFCVTNVGDAPATVQMGKGWSAPEINLQYSTDNNVYQEWTDFYNTPITIPAGGKLYFKGTNNTLGRSEYNYNNFIIKGSNVSISGDLTSLLDSNGNVLDLSGRDYVFKKLFDNCRTIIDAKDLVLPSEILSNYCYNNMFSYCTSLMTAPELPAIKMKESCYQFMFQDCSALVNAPTLPAMELAVSCYNNMFAYCNLLKVAPALPATTLADYCYNNMFAYCNSLKVAPALPATTLADYCYYNMFAYCSKINEITIRATTWIPMDGWVSGVSPTGTFKKPASLVVWDGTGEQPAGSIKLNSTNGIPEGWTVIDI